MHERRRHVRIAFGAHIKLMHPVVGELDVEMRDMSDGGVFLLTANRDDFPIGELVQIQALDIEDAPILSARVVRHEPTGIGLMFIEE
jgi:c-di-GMP-binding flagellar brake protein YcgR